MKKYYIIIILLFISVFSLLAQSYEDKQINDVKYDFSLNLGYNITGKCPIIGFKVGFEIFFLRADIDIGTTYLNHPLTDEKITTFSPSAGFFYGKKHKIYALIGVQNYALIKTPDISGLNKNQIRYDHIYGITKVGYQHCIKERFFLCVEAQHLFCALKKGATHLPNTNIRLAVGYRF
ncbi:MAG: porin family protein [Alphaproteobacteria bacterium]|nr:porin family protein [Alphaproteobacteria bacterium]